MSSRIRSIEVATPRGRLAAERAVELAQQFAPADVGRDRLERLHRRTEIESRATVVVDARGDQQFYAHDAQGRGPTTGARMERFAQHAGSLALEASGKALVSAHVAAAAVTHLVTVSCTGFKAPGFDQELARLLGLAPTVRRTHVGFMGCHAALNGLAVADAFCRADPEAVALLCCVELCSLHFHYGARTDQLIANALFADGAAAAVIGAGGRGVDEPEIAGFASALWPEGVDAMSWTVGDHGFEMTLSPAVADILACRAPQWAREALGRHGLDARSVRGWAIHPGGPRIVRAVGDALELTAADLETSMSVLRGHGNMSSPTVLFIVRELWKRGIARPWMAMAFGPGLAAEGALLR